MKKKLIAFACLATIGLSSAALSFADSSNETSGTLVLEGNKMEQRGTGVTVGGGDWYYDSWITLVNKHAQSDYRHDVNYHSSFASVGNLPSQKSESGRTAPGKLAEAHATGPITNTAVVKWNNQG